MRKSVSGFPPASGLGPVEIHLESMTAAAGWKTAISPHPHLCARHRDEGSAASAARDEFFQHKDLVWLDPCDEHRDEEIKQATAGGYPESQQALNCSEQFE
jgi:hypothetical protein